MHPSTPPPNKSWNISDLPCSRLVLKDLKVQHCKGVRGKFVWNMSSVPTLLTWIVAMHGQEWMETFWWYKYQRKYHFIRRRNVSNTWLLQVFYGTWPQCHISICSSGLISLLTKFGRHGTSDDFAYKSIFIDKAALVVQLIEESLRNKCGQTEPKYRAFSSSKDKRFFFF